MTVLRDADAAMYRAKDLGRARIELFNSEFRQRAARRLELESSLRHALDRGELRLAYQPIVSLSTGLTARDGVAAALGPPRRRLSASGRIHPGRRAMRADRR